MAPPPPPRSSARFDPWNSSSTGHQRSDHRPGTPWRDARARSLNAQFAGRDRDARLPAAPARRSVVEMLARPRLMREEGADRGTDSPEAAPPGTEAPSPEAPPPDRPPHARPTPRKRHIFDGLVVYVNGSTYPLVSDHRLKHLLVEHGATMSLHLARRSVTHVILARPAAASRPGGGGLAGGKLDREIRRTAGCGVKYVDVEW